MFVCVFMTYLPNSVLSQTFCHESGLRPTKSGFDPCPGLTSYSFHLNVLMDLVSDVYV